tara:strand:+ start:3965 stop:6988 length:3024 start_codon:yes stop_codon:yes gene_type:complete
MKQVNRKFLEEQVKRTLKEQAAAGQYLDKDGRWKFMTPDELATMTDRDPGAELWKAFEGHRQFIKEMLLGADLSYEDMKQWFEDSKRYGFGSSKYISKALDVVPKLKSGENAGLNQTTMRFLNLEPFAELERTPGDWVSTGQFTLQFNNLLPQLQKISKRTTKRILYKKKKKRNSFFSPSLKNEINSILTDMLIDRDNDFGHSIDSLANKYNLETATTLDLSKWPASPIIVKGGEAGHLEVYKKASKKNIQRYTQQIIDTKNSNIENLVERIIMSQFVYLRNMSIKEAIQHMGKNSDIAEVMVAIINFENFKNGALRAAVGALDIGLSLGSTAAAVYSGGLSLMATAPTQSLLRKTVFKLITTRLRRKMTVSAFRAANAMAPAATFKAQFIGGAPLIADQIYGYFTSLSDQITDLKNNWGEYRNIVKTRGNDFTQSEREAYYIKNIEPYVKDITNKHTTQMKEYAEILGVEPQYFEKIIKIKNEDHKFGSNFKTMFFKHNAIGDESDEYITSIFLQLEQNFETFSKERATKVAEEEKKQRALEEKLKLYDKALPKMEKNQEPPKIINNTPTEADAFEFEGAPIENEEEERKVKSDISQDKRAGDDEDLSSDERLRRLLNKKTTNEQNSNIETLDIIKWSKGDRKTPGNDKGQKSIDNIKKAVDYYISNNKQVVLSELPENSKKDPYYANIFNKIQEYINSKKTAKPQKSKPDTEYDADQRKVQNIRQSVGFQDTIKLRKPQGSLSVKNALAGGVDYSSIPEIKRILDSEYFSASSGDNNFFRAFQQAFGYDASQIYAFNDKLEVVDKQLSSGGQDLTSFRDDRIKYLKDYVHSTNMGKWRQLYKAKINAAAGDAAAILEVEKEIAFYHRPRYIVFMNTSTLKGKLGKRWGDEAPTLSFSFEPNTNRVYVGEKAALITHSGMLKPELMRNIVQLLSMYIAAAQASVKKALQLSQEEPENAKTLEEYIIFGKILSKILKTNLNTITSSDSALRKAYAVYSINTLFATMD